MKHGCHRAVVWAIAGALGAIAIAGEARAQSGPRFTAIVEGAGIWSSRNDVRIPPDTGTEFSIVDLIGTGPTAPCGWRRSSRRQGAIEDPALRSSGTSGRCREYRSRTLKTRYR
jgi:hypothetical protein